MTRNKKKPTAYAFANAFLGSQVRHLMSEADFNNLIGAKDDKAASEFLQGFGYEDFGRFNDIEGFIRKEQNKHFNMVFDTLSNRSELGMMLFPFDYHNIKVFLKAEFLGIKADFTYLISTSFIDAPDMEVMVRERDYLKMTKNMKIAIEEAVDLFNRSHDPQVIDLILDKYCYMDMLKGAMKTENQFLIDYVKLEIDLINLSTFVRVRQMGHSWAFLQKVYLEGGNIGQEFFISNFEENYANFGDKLEPYGLRGMLSVGGVLIEEKGDYSLFEKMKSDKKMEHIKKAKYQAFGLSPIGAYWLAKEAEIDNVRIVLVGRRAELSHQAISERLRETYV
ncbi:MAG: V-type ATPase subunit [Anaerovoracaceae bacterium]